MDSIERFRVSERGELVTDGPGYFWSENEPALAPFWGPPAPLAHADMVPMPARLGLLGVDQATIYIEDRFDDDTPATWAHEAFLDHTEERRGADLWIAEAVQDVGSARAEAIFTEAFMGVLRALRVIA